MDYGFGQTRIFCISWSLDYDLCTRPIRNGKWEKKPLDIYVFALAEQLVEQFAFGALQKLILNIHV